MRRGFGFTFTELMIVVAVVSVFATIGVPSFKHSLSSNRITAQANDLFVALSLARSESMKRSSLVTVCASSNGTSCTGLPWDDGWIVFTDLDGSGSVGAGETVLRVHEALKAGNKLTPDGGAVTWVAYRPGGQTMASVGWSGAFSLCDHDYDPLLFNYRRQIIVSPVGRITVARDAGTCP